MTDIYAFTGSNIARNKANADQTYLLDMIEDSHALMVRAAAIVADDSFKATPEGRELLGRAADWMRLFEQTISMLELEKSDAA